MKIDVKAFALTLSLLFGMVVLSINLANLLFPTYGLEILKIIAAAYPGYHANGSLLDISIGTIYGLADGMFGGVIGGLLYNFFLSKGSTLTS